MEISVKVQYKNDKLKNTREKSGLSQNRLAEQAGVSIRMIQHYEQGAKDVNGAKLSTLLKLCLALHCKLPDILTDDETLKLLDEYDK